MTSPRGLATAEQIHARLVDQLNFALRGPGRVRGEGDINALLGHLLFVEQEPEAITQQRRDWAERGLWTPLGVSGAFRRLLPGPNYEDGMASVYAEFAWRRGWLEPDRVLAQEDHEALTGRVREWASADRTWADVTAEFGSPSVLIGGSNPLYGKTLGYLAEDPGQPMVAFHLWNATSPGAESWPPELEQPVLIAVRFCTGPFHRSLTFTPEGERRKPVPGDPWLL